MLSDTPRAGWERRYKQTVTYEQMSEMKNNSCSDLWTIFFNMQNMCEKPYDLEIIILRLRILEGKSCWRVSDFYLFLLQVLEVINKYHCCLRKMPSALRQCGETEW